MSVPFGPVGTTTKYVKSIAALGKTELTLTISQTTQEQDLNSKQTLLATNHEAQRCYHHSSPTCYNL
jgi:hypothetical protein